MNTFTNFVPALGEHLVYYSPVLTDHYIYTRTSSSEEFEEVGIDYYYEGFASPETTFSSRKLSNKAIKYSL